MGRKSEHVIGDLSPYAAKVLDLVDQIPRGRVLTYGDVAELLGTGGPRQVGQVMATYGSLTCWHRVILATGGLPPGHEGEAAKRLRAERVAFRTDGARVDLAKSRWVGPG